MRLERHRHDRVWLAGRAWRPAVPDAGTHARLHRWIAEERPFVVRRREASMTHDVVPLAVALPLAEGRARIALFADHEAIVRTEPPLSLADVIAAAPGERRAALARLVADGAAVGTVFAVFGSFAWQAMSGAPCVTASSDLDLLWDARDFDHLHRTIALLLAWEQWSGLRADGEARFANGGAVAWRELASPSARILVKHDAGVLLRPPPRRDDTPRTRAGPNDDRISASDS